MKDQNEIDVIGDLEEIPMDLGDAKPPAKFDHLIDDLEKDDNKSEKLDSLQTISRYANELKDEAAEQKRLNELLSVVNARMIVLSQDLIPEAMKLAGTTSITLTSGETVSCKEDLSASLKDADTFYDFLEKRGDGAIMKIQLEIGKVPKTILATIIKTLNEKFGIMASSKKTVHPQTLKKYIKELCGIGGSADVVAEIPLTELDANMVGTFVYYKTIIK